MLSKNYSIPYRKALNVSIVILGVERRLFFFELILIFSLIMTTRFTHLLIYIPVLAIALHAFFVIATKADPLITEVFRRSWKNRSNSYRPNYFPAKPTMGYEPKNQVLSSFPETGSIKIKGRK
jgi:type IV secretory pathway TrbD component